MAHEPKLKIAGSEVLNVLSVTWSVRAGVDRDGRPTRGLFFDGLTIRRIQDHSTTMLDWSKSPHENNRKKGEIEFFSDTGKPMKKFQFENAYIQNYDVSFDHKGDHVVETVVIQAEKIHANTIEVDFNWIGKK